MAITRASRRCTRSSVSSDRRCKATSTAWRSSAFPWTSSTSNRDGLVCVGPRMMLALAVLRLSSLMAAGDSLLVPGGSHQLAEYRAAQLSAVRYELALDVTRRVPVEGHPGGRFVRRAGVRVVRGLH